MTKKRQDLAAEDLGQPRVVQTREPVENPRPVHSAVGHQEMQAGVKIVGFLDAIYSPGVFQKRTP